MKAKTTKNQISLHQENCKKWFHFLSGVTREKENIELITHYFFLTFSKAPEAFFEFLQYFEKKLKSSPTKTKKDLAHKYLEILSYLCERFGLFEEKKNLDDLCFQITNIKRYQKIDKILHKYQKDFKSLVNKIIRILKELLKVHGHNCDIKGRYKNLYSINKKLQQKSYSHVLNLKDLLAFRIIVKNNSTEACYEILDLLHDEFYPIVESFKDYITIPKINGYQSLHTGLTDVLPNLNLPIEVQIRTKSMDDFAEKGLAAHWIYSKGKKSKLLNEKEKKLVQHMTHLSQVSDSEDMVYFLSHYGDIFQLERGACIIDFAYKIHTDVGKKVISAIVNGKKVDVNYKIQECDKIKVITGTEEKVHPGWLESTTIKGTRKKIYESIRL